MQRKYSERHMGYTMIELLTVIAIIAILAAIMFPVAATVRERSRRAACMSNLHQIEVALKMYKLDQRVYPEVLLGYAEDANGNLIGPNTPDTNGRKLADIQAGYLYKAYVKDYTLFKCPNNDETDQTVLQQPVVGLRPDPNDPNRRIPTQLARFYRYDSYDVGQECNGAYTERYSLFRPFNGTADSGGYAMGAADDVCQLQYNNPPESTIVTWCTKHRTCADGQVTRGSKDLVLLLSGTVKVVESSVMIEKMLGGDPNTANPNGNNQHWCLD